MSFSLPQWPITFQAKANFNFNLGAVPVGPFIAVGTPCNLVTGKQIIAYSATTVQRSMYLLFPIAIVIKGRASYAVKNGDAVEVPLGSGQWYSVIVVDKVAAGFTNEHQSALIFQPYPLYATAPLWP